MEKVYCLFNVKEKTFYRDFINCGYYKANVIKTWKTFKNAKQCLDSLQYHGYNQEDYQVMLLSVKKIKENSNGKL